MDKFNGDWENRMLNEISSSTKEVENALKPVLNEKINSESATMDSMNYIDGQNMGNNETLASESRGKVRVLTPNNNYVNHDFNSNNDYNNEQNMVSNNYDSSSNPPSNPFFNTLGSAQALILISTAVLVVLVFIVSFSIMKYIGI